MAFIPNKPMHNRFVFRNVTAGQYKTYAKQYSRAKAGGVRSIYLWMSGLGILGIVTEYGKGEVIKYGKRKLGIVLLNTSVYLFSPIMVTITNATKVLDTAKSIHSLAAFCFECAEDTGNLMFLPFDMALFGQPIPIGNEGRFNFFTNFTDFLEVLP